MKLPHLRTFVSIAEHGSIRAAARALGVSQVAVTKSLKAFETQIEETLFLRSASGVVLTPQGKALLPRTKHILEQLHRLPADMGQLRGAMVSAALTPIASLFLLEPVLRSFKRAYPNVCLRLSEGILSPAIPLVRDGELDFALVAYFKSPAGASDLRFEPVFSAATAFLARAGHPLAGTRQSLADLTQLEWIQNKAPDGMQGHLVEWVMKQKLNPPRFMLCDSFSTTAGALFASDGVTCGPEVLLNHPVYRGHIQKIECDTPIPRAMFGFLARGEAPLTKPAAFLQKLLRQAAASRPEFLAA